MTGKVRAYGIIRCLSMGLKVGIAAAVVSLMLWPDAAQARFASGGTGLYRSRIFWLEWPATIANGTSATGDVVVDGATVRITCTVGNLVGAVSGYISGSFRGDALDELYNIGGSNNTDVGTPSNTMRYGIASFQRASTLTLACTGLINPGAGQQPYDLPGIVVAEAETNGGAGEFVQAQIVGAFTLTERLRGCALPTTAVVTTAGATESVRFSNPSNGCYFSSAGGPSATGPMGIAFGKFGSTAYTGVNRQVDVNLNISTINGRSAAAVGIIFDADQKDAPASYGSAQHLLEAAFLPDNLPSGTTNDIFTLNPLATPGLAATQMRLGASVDGEGSTALAPSVGATTDDTNGTDDENAFTTLLTTVDGTATYSLNVPYTQAATGAEVCGWIDFSRDGTFANDSAEESCVTVVAGNGNAALSWVPPLNNTYVAGNSYARFRIGMPAGTDSPTGSAGNGEVEDYPIVLRPRLRLNKATVPTTDGGLFNLTVNPAPTAAFTANDQGHGGTTGLRSVPLGSAVTLSETAGTSTNLAAYTGNMTCTNRASGTVYGPTAGTTHSYTTMSSASTNAAVSNTPATAANVNDTEITCVLSNTLNADLSITKSNTYTAAQPSDLPGDTVTGGANTTYTLVVTNNGLMPVTGAVVRDAPGAGITCPVGNAVTITGDGVPAGSFNIGQLTSAAGITLGTLNAGQRTTLSFTCTVN